MPDVPTPGPPQRNPTGGPDRSERAQHGEVAFEHLLARSRYLILIPVVVLAVAALGAFVYGTVVFVDGVRQVVDHPLPVGNRVGLFLVVIDLFLIGATLLIAAVGFYELFVSQVDVGTGTRQLPWWLEIRDLNDLKVRVVGMLVLVAAVTFVEAVVDFRDAEQVLESGAGIGAFIVALTVFIRFGGHGDR